MTQNKQKMQKFVQSICEEPLIKMNLQLFAEEADDSEDPEDKESISFKNQSELDSWFDKKMSKSLETAKAKWDKDHRTAIDAAKTEGQRLAQLSSEEKECEEARKKQEEEDQRLADITRRELRLEAFESLEEKELPKELIDAVILTNADDCKKSIESVEKAFREAVEKGVNDRLAASAETPPAGGNSKNSKESIGSRVAKAANERATPKTDLWGQK